MKEKTLVSTFTLIGSLASYYYGKTHDKDVVPYVMIGGFIGAWIGEIISSTIKNKNEDKNN
ncbi:MAG: hypothetical protein Q7W45_01045 [Bacteroidota bacterium]|jgi:uncharacterized membrane protein YfcA|nr:hypothetical protein [Bacteroidota bacterium]MDP3146685.1 hypothetical protein [Bacteroidota bacterium]